MAKGGKRPGAGRKPAGASIKRKFQDYFTEKEVHELLAELKVQMKTKPELLKFAVEQLFGKAPQRVELTGKDGERFVVGIEYITPPHGGD